jgi:nucleoside-diphosphate-sugar epimerase
MSTLKGEKVLITGLTGQVAQPIARALAADNEVWGAARFRSKRTRAALEESGVRCVAVDLEEGDLSAVPDDVTVLLNFAVAHTQDWDRDLALNAEAAGLLMHRCRGARAVLHCSSTGVYAPAGEHLLVESDPRGDSHAAMGLVTYSITKIAAEAVVRATGRALGLPTTIARLNVPYGDDMGWPAMHLEMMLAGQPVDLRAGDPCVYSPIHVDDLVAQLPALLDAASVPATVVNWAGSEVVSVEEWCTYLGELAGVDPTFNTTDAALPGVAADTTRLEAIAGANSIGWRDGFRRMVTTLHPERLAAGAGQG